MALLLSVDLGTEGVRAGAFDEAGHLLATAHSPVSTTYPRPGRAEQDPRDWWAALVAASRAVLGDPASAGAGAVSGIAVSTTASTVAVLDSDDVPLRPALLWMDVRAGAEADHTTEFVGKHPVLTWSGGGDAAEWLVPKAMWLAEHEPAVWDRAAHVVEAVDYLTYRLTGRWTASQMNAVCKWNYDPIARQVPPGLYADLGIEDLAGKLPDEVLPVGSVAGTLAAAPAAELGVSGAPVVAVGGIDAHMSLLGCGRQVPGLVSIVGGTSSVVVAEAADLGPSTEVWGPYPGALHPEQWLVECGQVSSGSVLRWLCEDVLGTPREHLPELVARAGSIPADSHGLLVLDHFMGNRTPYRDPRLRGAVLGLTIGATPAQLYRAAVEGVAYGTRAALAAMEGAGVPAGRLVLSGGIRHNPLWVQVTSEVLGRPLELVETDNLTLRAGAVTAAAATGLHADLDAAAEAYATPTRLIEPSAAASAAYDAGYDRYTRATVTLAPVLHELADSTGSRGVAR